MKKEKLDIVYEDKYIIVINKLAGLLTISDLKERNNTLYFQVSSYVKKQNKNNKIYIVHRLDKDTSGLIIFAKTYKVKKILQDNWQNTIRKYYGIVNGNKIANKGIIKSYLKENKNHFVYSTKKDLGDLAITEYTKIKNNNLYSLLDITIKTGRKNQIRVQLNDLGYSLVGDKKYGKIKNKTVHHMCLCAYYLEFKHPITSELIILKINYPKYFDLLIK